MQNIVGYNAREKKSETDRVKTTGTSAEEASVHGKISQKYIIRYTFATCTETARGRESWCAMHSVPCN